MDFCQAQIPPVPVERVPEELSPSGQSTRLHNWSHRAWDFGNLTLASGALDSALCVRTVQQVRILESWRQDSSLLMVATGGRIAVEADGTQLFLECGRCMLLDTDRQPLLEIKGNDGRSATLTLLRIPREALAASCMQRTGRKPNAIRMEGSSVAALSDHLMALTLYLSLMTVSNGQALADTTLRLVAASLNRERSSQGTAIPARRFWLHQVWRHIEQNLHNPALSPESICHALGLSRSTLYRHFSPVGGLAAYIGRRRIEEIRSALHDSAEVRSISELAKSYGFASSTSFALLFKRWFGCTPSSERASLFNSSSIIPIASATIRPIGI